RSIKKKQRNNKYPINQTHQAMSKHGSIRRYSLIIEKVGRNQFPFFNTIKEYLFDQGFEVFKKNDPKRSGTNQIRIKQFFISFETYRHML
ncbi:MAG: hypothetical protein Q8Q33_00120, partial [Chlamydiota bacterium]|nr:hypothetical protein [Chlamydiota bacterium]